MRSRTLSLVVFLLACTSTLAQQPINLPSSKVLLPVPGAPQRLNSYPAASALSPDKRYLAILNQGYSLPESHFQQSIAILDLQTNQLRDFPDARLGHKQKQTYFFGLAWSHDGARLYCSIASLTNPEGKQERHTDERTGKTTIAGEGDIGNGIAVYHFTGGALAPERFIPIAPQPIAGGKKRAHALKSAPAGTAPPFPAGLAVIASAKGERLLVADNLSDDALLLDAADGRVLQRFDFSAHAIVPAEYPVEVVASADGRRAWVSLWNASRVAELDLAAGAVTRTIPLLPPKAATDAGSHPTALLLSRDEKLLYVALANADAIAVIETASGRVLRNISTALPGQQRPGAYPIALAESPDGKSLYCADAAANAVAIIALPAAKPRGFIPTEWYPTSLAVAGDDLIVISAKGKGTGPNSGVLEGTEGRIARTSHPYIYSLLGGSVGRVKLAGAERNLAQLTREVLQSNRMDVKLPAMPFGGKSPIHHVVYIIKENRAYDQVFGDIKEANGDASLVMYGEAVTPNHHKLARQFGVLDNFYVSGEVSGDGHVWSDAAITSDYTEATVQINYRNAKRAADSDDMNSAQRTYDFEGTNFEEFPLDQGEADVNEPGTGYLWTNAARHGLTYRIYGEGVMARWCNLSPEKWNGPLAGSDCARKAIKLGEPLPADRGFAGAPSSPWPWNVPIIASTTGTKPEIRGHFNPQFPNFELSFPDQFRADIFLHDFDSWVQARAQHRQQAEMPQLIIMQLPNDHTAGTKAGDPKPAASLADNDIALGRVVEAISHSPYWDDTAIFVLEDDAQNGPDHVDAHRSPGFVISRYNRTANVDSHFYTTVNMIRTIEALLGLPPMNHNDAQAAPMWTLFAREPAHAPYSTDYTNRDNGLIYQANPPTAPGAATSQLLDFSRPDAADADVLNAILWREAKGDVPMPQPRHARIPQEDQQK